jgi:predicted GNAT superfamily acetyltransferase
MSDLDILPSTVMIASIEVGASLLGAFVNDKLAGFAFAFPGIEKGTLILHSDMLGVDPEYRNHNLGFKLKLAQRERALEMGVKCITWTFDPLQSLNAHFNFAKLGVLSDCYRTDFYGETSSFLHRLGTDRLWVSWLLQSHRVNDRLDPESNRDLHQSTTEYASIVWRAEDGHPERNHSVIFSEDHLLLEIPDNINDLVNVSPDMAAEWSETARWAFTSAIAAGYLVEEFIRIQRDALTIGAYVLKQNKTLADFE